MGAGKQELPYMKIEDTQYFAKLLEDVDEEMLSTDEQKERKIMRLLLKIKNGTPPMRKVRGGAGRGSGCGTLLLNNMDRLVYD